MEGGKGQTRDWLIIVPLPAGKTNKEVKDIYYHIYIVTMYSFQVYIHSQTTYINNLNIIYCAQSKVLMNDSPIEFSILKESIIIIKSHFFYFLCTTE
jgi:hypothetical protein